MFSVEEQLSRNDLDGQIPKREVAGSFDGEHIRADDLIHGKCEVRIR